MRCSSSSARRSTSRPPAPSCCRSAARSSSSSRRPTPRWRSSRASAGGKLNVAVISAGDYFFPRLLVEFASRHRGVALNFTVHNREGLLNHIANNLTDLAIMVRPPTDLDTVHQPFAPHPYVIVAPPGHPLVGKRQISQAALLREPFIVREKASDNWKSMEEGFGGDLGDINIAMEIRSTETIKQAVLARHQHVHVRRLVEQRLRQLRSTASTRCSQLSISSSSCCDASSVTSSSSGASAAAQLVPQHLRDAGCHQRRVGQRRQLDQPDTRRRSPSRSACATACPTRVLPMPPAPAMVTSRCSCTSRCTACTSASRPYSGASSAGRLVGVRAAERRRWGGVFSRLRRRRFRGAFEHRSELVAAPGDRRDHVGAEQLAQRPDLHLQVVLFDHQVRPAPPPAARSLLTSRSRRSISASRTSSARAPNRAGSPSTKVPRVFELRRKRPKAQ